MWENDSESYFGIKLDYVAIFSLIRDFFDQILVLFFIFNTYTFHGLHYINIFVFLFINFYHSHEMNSRGSWTCGLICLFICLLFFCLVCLLPHYQEWTSLRDLRRRCVVNILTLNTVNQQSYNECQLYYFYLRKIKTFLYQDQNYRCIYFHCIWHSNRYWDKKDISYNLTKREKEIAKIKYFSLMPSSIFHIFTGSLAVLLLFCLFQNVDQVDIYLKKNKSTSLTSHNIYYCKDTFSSEIIFYM